MRKYYVYGPKITDIHQNRQDILDFIHWTDHAKSDSKVFIKPNGIINIYKEGIPPISLIVKDLIGFLKDGAKLDMVGESNERNHQLTSDAVKETGLLDRIQLIKKCTSKFIPHSYGLVLV
jgi:hypothetical protein